MTRNKFKVGDKVKVRNDLIVDNRYYDGCRFAKEMDKYKGQKATIINITDSDRHILDIDKGYWNWTYDMLQPVNFTKDDLQDGDIVTLRNGDKLVYSKYNEDFTDLYDSNHDNYLCDLYNLDDDLTCNSYDEGSDIVKVERPTSYATMYEREENEVKEMTIAEIIEALGYEVKIVKETE